MISYEELYEILRKEKFGENLQSLQKDFVKQFSDYLCDNKRKISRKDDYFSEDVLRSKKEYDNSMTLFKELILRRKKKILNLVFVATETGVMKRDLEDMLPFEQDLFDKLMESVKNADKSVSGLLDSCSLEDASLKILIKEDIEQFVDMTGEIVGPFKTGDEVNLDGKVAEVLISGNRAEISK